MKKVHENKLSMYLSLERVIQANVNEWAGQAGYTQAYSRFLAAVSAIEAQRLLDEADRSGTAEDKVIAKEEMTRMVLAVAGGIVAFATVQGDNALKELVNLWKTDLIYARDTTALANGKLVAEQAGLYLAQLGDYGIDVQKLAELNAVLTRFEDLIGEPRAEQVRGMAAREEIERQVSIADLVLKDELDMLMRQWEGTAFFVQYKDVRKVLNY